MAMTRREWIGAVAAAGALPMAGGAWAQAGTLKISHQFPGGTATEGDFRDRLCRRFAADIEKRSNGALKAAVYPGSSLMKTNAQFSAMRKGALDISLYPLSYAGGEVRRDQHRPDAGAGAELRGRRAVEDERGRQAAHQDARREGHRRAQLDLAGRRRRQPRRAARPARGRQGPQGARRQPRDGHDAEGGRRVGDLAAVERDLRGDADRRDGRGDDVVDQLHLVQARGDRQAPDQRPQQGVLVHVRAAADVEGGLRQAAEGAAGHHHAGRRGAGEVRDRGGAGPTTRSPPTSTRRPAPRSTTSTRRPFASGRRSRATRRGRTTASAARRRPRS